jgi:hypothetical protein
MMSATLITHCGGKKVTYQDVWAVQTPQPEGRYHPVDYGELLQMVEDMADATLGLSVKSVELGLAREGKQMFAAYTFESEGESGLSIGVRSSHDKSLSVGVCAGARVFVCDNLAFSGETMNVVRKHTTNVWGDVRDKVASGLAQAGFAHDLLRHNWEQMKGISLSRDEGFGLLGRALGHDVVKPQQATRALRAWKGEFAEESPFPQHGQTLYGIYQSLTEGAKQGSAIHRMPTLVGVDAFVRKQQREMLALDAIVTDIKSDDRLAALAEGLEID